MTILQNFDQVVLDEVCPAGEAWMCEVKKGQFFRIIDLEGNQAVDTLFISAENPEERYSATDNHFMWFWKVNWVNKNTLRWCSTLIYSILSLSIKNIFIYTTIYL